MRLRRVGPQAPYPYDLSRDTRSVPGVSGTTGNEAQRPADHGSSQKSPALLVVSFLNLSY